MMRKAMILILLVVFSTLDVFAEDKKAKQSPQWKAGVATVVITPEQEIWMAGYGGRKKPSPSLKAIVSFRGSSMNQAFIVCSVCPPPSPRDVSTPRQRPSLF